MATNFPTSVDNFTNPTANDSLNLPSHSTQHANANDAIEAIETYLLNGGQGLTYLNTTTFSAQASVVLDGIFTSAYDNYLIEINLTSSGATTIYWNWRTSGANKTSGYYGASMAARYDTGATRYGLSTNNGSVMNLFSHSKNRANLYVGNPTNASVETAMSGTYNEMSSYEGYIFGGTRSTAEAHDGFQIQTSSGTFSGTIRVYGLRNS
jgi:hypothetical protein